MVKAAEFVVKCRGLPYSCTEKELRNFFGGSGIIFVNLHMRDGRASGDATVTFDNEVDYEYALKKDKEHMGHRYIDVTPGSATDRPMGGGGGGRGGGRFDRGGRGGDRGGFRGGDRGDRGGRPTATYNGEGVVRLRGLPYGAHEEDIYEFFAPLPIVHHGVLLPDERTSAKTNGEAYVVFNDQESADRALQRHMKNIQHRYIEVFSASYQDMVRFAADHKMRVPRGSGSGSHSFSNGGVGGPPRSAFDSPSPFGGNAGPAHAFGGSDRNGAGYPPFADDGFGAFPPGYGGARPMPPFERGMAPTTEPALRYPSAEVFQRRNGGPMEEPYPPPRGGGDDMYGRPIDAYGRPDPYSRQPEPSREDPFGRASRGVDPYQRPTRPPMDRFDREPTRSAVPYGGGARGPSMNDDWRGAAPGGGGGRGGYGDAGWEGYGGGADPYLQSSGGGPMRGRGGSDPWRDDRPRSRDEAGGGGTPRGRERPGAKYILKMRGVPYRASESDIYDFFEPIRPGRVELGREPGGRPSGEARVEFASRKEYDEALLKDKQYMGARYVELFPDFGGRY